MSTISPYDIFVINKVRYSVRCIAVRSTSVAYEQFYGDVDYTYPTIFENHQWLVLGKQTDKLRNLSHEADSEEIDISIAIYKIWFTNKSDVILRVGGCVLGLGDSICLSIGYDKVCSTFYSKSHFVDIIDDSNLMTIEGVHGGDLGGGGEGDPGPGGTQNP